MRRITIVKCVVSAALIATCGIGGCSKAPNKNDQSKVEEAKTAAESAEKKLYDTRQERMRLEAEHGQKKSEDK
jgi:outer membrane murein-binding lipoprotein Lpp